MHRDDLQLLTAASAGDRDAFDQLVEPWRMPLLLFIRSAGRSVLGADFDEDDTVQLTLHKAWQLLDRFAVRDVASFERWLRALARGVLADRVRYRGATRRGDARRLESVLGDAAGFAGPLETASMGAAEREEVDRAEAALARLPDRLRVVVELHVLEARSLAEVAEQLELSKNAVFERLRKGLASLRVELGPRWSSLASRSRLGPDAAGARS